MKKKGKGLSFDQKRERMLAIFHRTRDVFNYQEIEKLSVKAGIPFPTVKEILGSLRDDSLVESEKIGAGVFYWSFPSRSYQIMNERLSATKLLTENCEKSNKKLQQEIERAKQERQATQRRQWLLTEVQKMSKKYAQLQKDMQVHLRLDPQRYELLTKQNSELRQSINTEIDDLEQIRKYIKNNQIGIKNSEIEQNYGIPEELQYEDE